MSLFFIFHTVQCRFFSPASLFLSGAQVARIWNRCICHLGAEYSQSLGCEKRECLSLPFWKLDWRELKGPVCQLGERRAEELLLATHHLEKLKSNFFFFWGLCSFASIYWVKVKLPRDMAWGRDGVGGWWCPRQLTCLASMRVDLKWVKGSL